jgi:hypothetical protein
MAAGLGLIQVAEVSFSRGFLARNAAAASKDQALRDNAAARLGEVAFGVIQAVDASAPTLPQSDSWLVVGRSVWPGWLLFLLGLLTLAPGLIALRSGGARLAMRVVHAGIFTTVLYYEPEVALFVGALPNLLPPSASRKLLAPALLPFGLLLCAGALTFVRGQVTGSWLPVWIWAALAASVAILYATPGGGSKKAPAKPKRGKR